MQVPFFNHNTKKNDKHQKQETAEIDCCST